MIPFVDLQAQYRSIKTEVDQAVLRVLDSAQFVLGPAVQSFEHEFAKYCQTSEAVGVNSGTSALHLSLLAAGVGPNDEVITVPFTFVATVAAIEYAGAKPVFVDVEPDYWTMDPNALDAAVTPRTKAVMPVHLYGQPADMDPILALAKKHNLRVVGDAAQAHGAMYKGRPIAALADITCYSFYPGKNLGAYGDGGALVTNNAEWAATARMIANHGRTKKYDHDFEGVNSRLDGIQAAILSVKLRHIERWTESRRKNAHLYNVALKGKGVGTPEELQDVRAVYHLYVIRVPADRRDAFQEFLKAANIDTGIHYPIALPYLNAYRHLGHTEADFSNALEASHEIVSLPMFPELTEDQIRYVAERVQAFVTSAQ